MVGLREKLRRWHDSEDDGGAGALAGHSTPEFTFIRTDTHTAEVIHPPSADGHLDAGSHFLSAEPRSDSRPRRSLDVFRSSRSRSASVSSNHSSGHKRLSERLHLSRSPPSSENVPQDLPEIVVPEGGEEDKDGTESQWEKRATILARENEKHRSRPGTPVHGSSPPALSGLRLDGRASEDLAPPLGKAVSSKEIDADIQEAIRLHEEGRLEESTAIFGRLADPKGANNPLSQVLYGLALRHGWGCKPDTAAAVSYLSAAASNAADIEQLALQAGLKKGGAAKGELVLAIFELANCFRHGWGIPKDPVAAKQYYETAANLGDTDAMNEVAWCYLEGFGTKKDKYAAAKYYRLAEKNGNKILGNSW
ncbi:01693bea-0d99-4539-8394-0ff58ef04a4b [Thermothielavioides terrestris]|uniref:01693bea-0d99-4539-8394-0ff58ef04a4b n=1 Tax=Thermothielavioides terrestris TaxID=2587410 RepID=A0A446B9X9_9PEZI|nr:01693bea-0d99-4539-8394-0ff58ef04a4b [Thermothielavioides terrestris]